MSTITAIAYNVSVSGIGVTMPFAPQLGTILQIQAWDLATTTILQARVVRTAPVEFPWFCGCELTDWLGQEELQAWLSGAQDWLSQAETLQ